jgi:capsular exopolysaccharide synthesis family protein
MEILGISPHLTDYYYLVRRRAWLVLSAIALTVLFAALFTFSMKPVYRATASLIIDKETTHSPLTGQQLETETFIGQQLTFRTHFNLIKSRSVLEKVLQQLGPAAQPERSDGVVTRFLSTVRSNLSRGLSWVFSPLGGPAAPQNEETLLLKRIGRLSGKISIEGIRDTRLLLVHVEDNDPQTARTIADAVAENYILYDSETRLDSARKIFDWLSKQLYEMKKKVEEAEKAFQAFKERENLITIEGSQTFNVQKIQEMNADYIKAKSQRMEVEANIQELKKFIDASTSGNVKTVPTFLNDPLLGSLNSELLNAEIEYQRLAGVYRPKHPEIVKVTSQISELKTKLHQQLQKILTNAEATRSVLLARENSFQQATKDIEKDAIDTNRKELQYAILERDVSTNKELYNTLLAKIKQANITDEIMKSNLRVAEPAALPMAPVRPQKVLYLTLSAFFGLAFGIGLAFFFEYMDQTVYSNEVVAEALDVPVLSEIPLELKDKEPKGEGQARRYSIPSVLDVPFASHFSESFRQLATNLRFSELNRTRGVYLVTSANPKEGKSTLVFNLGLTMAQIGMKTLIIEADLRIPSMKRIVKQAERRGLTEILADSFSTKTTGGTLGELTMGDIHKLIEMQERTGTLHYQNGLKSFAVSFVKGQLIDVDWSSRPPEKKLGALLVQTGKITEKQLNIALASQQATTERLGQILLHLGFLSVEELAGPLRLHIQENIDELFHCEHAEFKFDERPLTNSTFRDTKETALIEAMGRIENDLSQATPFLLNQIQECLYKIPEQNMWVLTSGKTPPNPPELLASNRMRVLVELLRRQYDMIIIDSPPVATVNDAAVLASLCDGLILLVKAGSTDLTEVKRAKQKLDAVQAPTVGLVLNMLDFKKDPYYYGRYYYKRYDSYYTKTVKSEE